MPRKKTLSPEELCQAAREGDLRRVDTLLVAGTAVDATDKRGWTALLHAAWMGHAPVVQRLLEADANLNACDSQGCTAYELSTRGQHESVVALLLEAGGHPEGLANEEGTPRLCCPFCGAWSDFGSGACQHFIAGTDSLDPQDEDAPSAALELAEMYRQVDADVDHSQWAQALERAPSEVREVLVALANYGGSPWYWSGDEGIQSEGVDADMGPSYTGYLVNRYHTDGAAYEASLAQAATRACHWLQETFGINGEGEGQ